MTQSDVDDALDELLFSGGSLNRKLLGGGFEGGDDASGGLLRVSGGDATL